MQMKVPLSLRAIYDTRVEIYTRLKGQVDDAVAGLKEKRWHYESRVKSLESFALKIESGRFSPPEQLEDFFACTLVVENAASIAEAERRIKSRFPADLNRRPPDDTKTAKRADSFPFDDLRLYPKWSAGSSRPDLSIEGLRFEIQVKTFLQHAWTIATHELVYKADEISWAKRRIAYQIKAMLEHAEVSITEAGPLSKTPSLRKIDKRTDELIKLTAAIKKLFTIDQLPRDIIRLVENTWDLLQATNTSLDELRRAVTKETSEGRGIRLVNLSPFGILLQSLGNVHPDRVTAFLQSPHARYRMLLPQELSMPVPASGLVPDRLLRL